ncbi:MAG TPA: alpha/beta hydrolase [Stellaceae bacterium]|jgi:pimeloyl-ACP methyl ester carboxylesterase|nr:alpha/beta hydrolase [Stellaceae bacterium]
MPTDDMSASAIDNAALLERLAAANGIPYRPGAPPAPRRLRTPEGLSLNLIDWGGDGAPILFLHGGSLTAHSWDLVCLALGDRFRCVALDLRGHGESDWAEVYTIDACIADVAAIVAALGCSRVHVVGMSLGGNIAAHYAHAAGPRLASLTMVDVGPSVDFAATATMRNFMDQPIAELTLDQLVDAALRASTRGGQDKILYRYRHLTQTTADGRLAWRQDRRKPHDYAHIFAKIQELDALARDIDCRVLLVRGALSRVWSDAAAADFTARFRDARWLSIPDAGHNIPEDNPQTLAEALRTFLSEIA